MDVIQACNLLDIEPGASTDEVDKAFRKLAAKHHPDRNANDKEAAEEKFKKVNEAYQLLKEHGTNPRISSNPFNGNIHYSSGDAFRDMFNDFFRASSSPFQRTIRRDTVLGALDISFEESIKGTQKNVTINRQVRCSECKGTGVVEVLSDSKCEKCNGDKYVNVKGKDLPCTRCGATGFGKKANVCGTCLGIKHVKEDKNVNIKIPPGVESGASIRLAGHGGIVNGQNTDAIYRINVIPDSEMERLGEDVISSITISLLEALTGTSKQVRTAYGSKNLKIKAGVKNKDNIRVRNFGVGNIGSHIFVVNVEYPHDTQPIIDLLKDYPESKLEDIEGE